MNVRETTARPLYHELADTLRRRILSGAFPKGAQIPSESELQQDTGLSRSTVRKALEVLVEEGLITKERGRGAFVRHVPAIEPDDTLFFSFTSDMAQQGRDFTTRMVDARLGRADAGAGTFLGLGEGAPVVELVRMRYIDALPFCLETTILAEEFSELVDEKLDSSLYAVLRERYHRVPARGHKTFEVCHADTREAFLLDVERGSALMLVTDYVLDIEDAPLHVSRRVMRTDQVKYAEPIR